MESANYVVDFAKNGRDALVRLLSVKDTNYPVDLLVTDLCMPVMSGSELIDALRRFKIDIPVLVITSYDSNDIKNGDCQSDNIEYLTKPFGDHEFLARINKLFANDNIIHKHRCRI